MAGGYSVSGRGPFWARTVVGLGVLAAIAVTFLTAIAVTFLAPKPYPDLSVTTAHGAWFATLASSLLACLALASSIPMRKPDISRADVSQTLTVPARPVREVPPRRAAPTGPA